MNLHLRSFFAGPGGRRRTPDSIITLERDLRALRSDAALLDPCNCRCPERHIEFLVRRKEGIPAPVEPIRCPACEIERLIAQHRAQLSVLTAPPAPPSPVLVPAAVDTPGYRPLPDAPPLSADDHLLLMPDAPKAPVAPEAADVNAETQSVEVTALRQALGEGDTATLPAVPEPVGAVRPVIATTADHLEPAHAQVPPVPRQIPVHLIPQQRVTWNPFRDRDTEPDPLAGDDLKALVSPSGLPGENCWQTVSLTKV